MSFIQPLLFSYVFNGLWQTPLIFAAAWLIARTLRPFGPAIEHRVWAAGLLLESLLPAFSLLPLHWNARHSDPAPGQVSVSFGPAFAGSGFGLSRWPFTAVAILYTLVTAFFMGRLLWRAGSVLHLRRTAGSAPLTPEAEAIWKECLEHFHLLASGTVTLAVSHGIAGPVTLGVRRRLVLFPADMIPGLALPHFKAVIAHECAHLYRDDFGLNLLYEAASVLISYHPVLWLTRERLIETREMACDYLAAQFTGPTLYGQSLLRLASLLITGRSARAPHAIGILDANLFERRLMKLTEQQQPLVGARRRALVAVSAAFALGTCGSALALRLNIETPIATPRLDRNDGRKSDLHKVAAGVMAGNILSKVAPIYPEEAKKAGIQGAVLLHAIIGKDGTMQNLTVISGPPELRTSSLEAVRQWVYKPYLLNGDPTEVDTTITINYSLGTEAR